MTAPLPSGAVAIWLAWPERIAQPELLARYRALLSADERARAQRFHFERDRHIYEVAHALVRCTLSRYGDRPPADWRFEANEYGRPEAIDTELCFNLSHTRGLIACAVTRGAEVGVDVEHIARRGETVSIADRFFAAAEVRALRALPAEQQRARFFRYWTLKESYIKARGMGLALPLHKFALNVEEPAAITISFADDFDDDPGRWRFGVDRPGAEHALAYAVEHQGAGEPEVSIRTTVPLVGDLPR